MLNVREFYCLLSPVDDDDDVQEQQPCLYQCDDHQLHPGDRQSSSPRHRRIPYSDVQLIQSFICSLVDMFGMEKMIAVIGYSMLSSPKMDVVPTEHLATI